jgi:DNA-binding CsgD family transcriptional regulator
MNVVAHGAVATESVPVVADNSLGLAVLFDELAHGVIVVNVEGKVLHSNQAASHELARKRVLEVRNALLHACTPAGGRILLDALAGAGQGKRSLIDLPGADGPGLTVAAIPLKPSAVKSLAKAALVFSRAQVCDPLMLGFFARSHRLTATEEQVLGVLCQGYSAPEIASRMKVAVSTVRSHVRSLCVKTRTSGVRELVSRVAVLPPVAPALWHEPMH